MLSAKTISALAMALVGMALNCAYDEYREIATRMDGLTIRIESHISRSEMQHEE